MGTNEKTKSAYINEIHDVYKIDNEIHLTNDDWHLVFDCDELFKNLFLIVSKTIKARDEETKMHINLINETLKDLK